MSKIIIEAVNLYFSLPAISFHFLTSTTGLNLKIMNEKMSKRRIQIKELQKLKMYEKEERRLLIRLHIFYLILLINLYTKNEN
jgi:hypothetical protein